MNRHEQLRDYFQRYAHISFGPDIAQLVQFYEDSFVAAGPKGSAAFRNDESFVKWLRELHAFNEKSGMTSMSVHEVSETSVGGGYTFVAVTWAATFEQTGKEVIRFRISYLLRESDATWKIVAYVSHEDQEETMRAKGLL